MPRESAAPSGFFDYCRLVAAAGDEKDGDDDQPDPVVIEQIAEAVEKAKNKNGKPTAIICKSVKGKGVSFMEDKCDWHGSAPNAEQYAQAMAELDEAMKSLEV